MKQWQAVIAWLIGILIFCIFAPSGLDFNAFFIGLFGGGIWTFGIISMTKKSDNAGRGSQQQGPTN